MANEFQVSFRLALNNGYLKDTIDPGTVSITQTTIGGPAPGMQSISTDEVVVMTDIAAPRLCWIRNLDTTNSVTFGPTNAGAIVNFLTLKPGEWAFFPLAAAVSLRGVASAGTVKCAIKAYET